MRTSLLVSLFGLLVFSGFGQLLLPLALANDAQAWTLRAPNWDRYLAMEVASTANIEQETDQLLRLVTSADSAAVMSVMKRLVSRNDGLQPAREATIYEFVKKLRQFEPFSVNAEILDFLMSYQPQVWVADEESITSGVPLFPIRATTAGMLHQWTRQKAEIDAAALLRDDPEELLSRYAANPDINIRSGIESAISGADVASLLVLLDHGMPLLADDPDLTGLLGTAAMAAGELSFMAHVFIYGNGPSLVAFGRQLGKRFSPAETGEVLLSIIESAPAGTAAIAIAEMSPYSIEQSAVGEALLNMLDDPTLGSAAALSLATWGTKQQREALKARVEETPSSLAAKRAQTALSLETNAARGELQR